MEDHPFAGIGRNIQNLGIHSDRILRACFHTKTAVDAFSKIDHKTLWPLLDMGIRMFFGLNVNAAGWANCLTHHTCDAAGRTILPFRETVPRPRTRSKR